MSNRVINDMYQVTFTLNVPALSKREAERKALRMRDSFNVADITNVQRIERPLRKGEVLCTCETHGVCHACR